MNLHVGTHSRHKTNDFIHVLELPEADFASNFLL